MLKKNNERKKCEKCEKVSAYNILKKKKKRFRAKTKNIFVQKKSLR